MIFNINSPEDCFTDDTPPAEAEIATPCGPGVPGSDVQHFNKLAVPGSPAPVRAPLTYRLYQ